VVRKVRGEVATRYSFRDRKIDVLVRARSPTAPRWTTSAS
jgi:hypothetical protein